MDSNLRRWDATRLASLHTCPTLLLYRNLEGWSRSQEPSADLVFGGDFADAVQAYWAASSSLESAISHVIAKSKLDPATFHVKGWRCTGSVPYKNPAGNRAKCPRSLKGVVLPLPAPATCSCGSDTEVTDTHVETGGSKNLPALLRTLTLYDDLTRTRLLRPAMGLDGPYVEHAWKLHCDGIELHGRYDMVAIPDPSHPTEALIVEYKTTGLPLDAKYWRRYSPNIQVDLYGAVAPYLHLHDDRGRPLNIKGVMVEAFSTAAPEIEHDLRIFPLNPDAIENELRWIEAANVWHASGKWPMSKTSCPVCPFREVCAAPASERAGLLAVHFTQRRPELQAVERFNAPSRGG